jgi:hypothetical protein
MLLSRNRLRLTTAVLVLAAAAHLAAMKAGRSAPRPEVLAVIVAIAALAAGAMGAIALVRVARGPGRVAPAAEALVALGLLSSAAAGSWNWARGIQGAVLLVEEEPVHLGRAGDLDAFARGPLADAGELDLTMAVARVTLEPVGPGGFRPVTRLKVLDRAGQEEGLSVSRSTAAVYRSLVFHQGAFGFAPRLYVVKDGRTLLDTFVPFRTAREGPDGVSFLGELEITAERLLLRGAVTLEDLGEDMKGHPTLELVAERDGAVVGKGTLRPGAFAVLSDGTRVAFSGLRRWSEIDFSRRTYRLPMLAGAVLLALGLVAWPLAAWRRW